MHERETLGRQIPNRPESGASRLCAPSRSQSLGKGLALSTFVRVPIWILIGLTAVSMISSSDPNLLVEPLALAMLSGLALILHVALGFGNAAIFPLTFLLSLFVAQKYLLGGWVLASRVPNFADPYGVFATADFTRMMTYAFLGTSVFLLGLMSAPRRLFQRHADVDRPPIDEWTLAWRPAWVLCYALVVGGIFVWLNLVMGVRLMAGPSESEWNFLNNFIRQTTPRNIVIAQLVFGWELLSRRDRWYSFATLSVLLGASVIGGSRSLLQIVAVLWLVATATRFGDFVLSWRNIRWLTLVTVFAIVLYPFATAVRWAGTADTVTYAEIGDQYNWLYGPEGKTVLDDLLNRLTTIDKPMQIMSDRSLRDVGDLLSMTNFLKRVANTLVPGDIFPDVLASQYLHDEIYYERGFRGFNAEEWGLWEYFYVASGYWGGLLLTFLTGVVLASGWHWLRASSRPLQPIWTVAYLYLVWQLLQNYELAYTVASFLIECISLVTWTAIVFLLNGRILRHALHRSVPVGSLRRYTTR
jgi:hypothetical protein